MDWAYYLASGLENLSTMLSLWVDFITLCAVTMYFLHFRNPVLNRKITKVKWCTQEYTALVYINELDIKDLNLDQVVVKYNELYNIKNPN